MQKHLFSNRDLLSLILPLIVEQFLVITLGLADIIMVGELGEVSVAAASLGDNINVLITSLFGALATGGAVVCAHYFGSRDSRMVGRTAKQLIYSTLSISLVLTIIGLVFQEALLRVIFGNVEDEVMRQANVYFFYSLLSYPFIALYSACAALFRTQGNSRIAMLASLLINILNIGGNAFCIYHLRTGIEGVAIPTLVSRMLAALMLFILLYQCKPYRGSAGIDIRGITKARFDVVIIRKIFAIGIPNGIENSVFQIGKILVLTVIARFGTGAVAANAAAATLITFQCLPGIAMGFALITVIGRALGTGNVEEALYLNKKLLIITYIAMTVVILPLLIFSRDLLALFKLTDATAALAFSMFMVHGLFSIVIWTPSFVLPASLRAANDAKFTMLISLASMWSARVGLSYLFVNITDWGAMSIWYAMVIDWFIRAGFFIHRWHKRRWIKNCGI